MVEIRLSVLTPKKEESSGINDKHNHQYQKQISLLLDRLFELPYSRFHSRLPILEWLRRTSSLVNRRQDALI